MVTDRAVAEMTANQVLDFVEDQHAVRQQAERDILRAAYQWAVLHNPDTLPVHDKRGRDRARPAGAEGTPRITEYAAATFGARIQTSPLGAKRLIADAVDLHHRLPKLQAGIDAGTVRVRHARHVAEATRDLTSDEAAWVDHEVHEVADGRLPWTRFETLVEPKITAAAPELARAKEEAAEKDRFVRMSRVNRHGIATLTIRDHATVILAADTALNAVATSLEETLPDVSKVERKLAAFAHLVNPDTHPDLSVGPVKPKVKIYLHLTPDSPIARFEGHGPVTTAWVRKTIAHVAGKVQVLPVIDLNQTMAVDAYEIPRRLREMVHLIHPADVFPYAVNTSRNVDIDHQEPHSEGGPTSSDNLAPLTRTHHRIKTHAGWQARQPFPGITIWRDPHGAHYLVDPTGTRRITPTRGEQTPTPMEIHGTRLLLDWAA
ncbi:HNH endonuclease signature motif containing protein [Nocardioides sp. J54]|uniref:HNH endonuclease signature motif containing protein n=1 Tax=Nocardioides sp. J54 TaxID=935866 RepID=UPI00048E4E9E|nr:HNH endonuclease signature motif containing protein [Nocardioides sp. J54]